MQVKNAKGQWITAAPIPGTFVCNVGDMLKVYTNGLYEPTPHRVINADPSRSRVSIPFFYEPAFEAEVGSCFLIAFSFGTYIASDHNLV